MDWIFTAAVVAVVGLGILVQPLVISKRLDARFATTFCLSASWLGVLNLFCVIGRTLGPESVRAPAKALLEFADHATAFVIGITAVLAFLSLVRRIEGDVLQRATMGTAAYVSASFLGFEVGKATHDAEMREFFVASGLPIWLMYVVMTAEIVGAIALLFGTTRRSGAALLALIMVAAISTHLHNGDPIQDSVDAIRMLVLSGGLFLCARAGVRTKRSQHPTPV
jgi:uncharacterized membrane protein YphA (DoxX/SURF4 family)